MPTRSTGAETGGSGKPFLPVHEAGRFGQFEEETQEREAATLGMWTFLSSEILFFGALFAGYFIYRMFYPGAFAEASGHLHRGLGALNSAFLLVSSVTMSLAIRQAALGRGRALATCLGASAALGAAFLVVKGYEYGLEAREGLVPFPGWEFRPPGVEGANVDAQRLFFILYFILTGIHGIHLAIGIGLVSWMAAGALFGVFQGPRSMAVELVALYWHFVDLVWIFLFPMLYLAR
jgi:cytochrome c oxidase subunit 3